MTFGIEKELLLFDKKFQPLNFMQSDLPKNVVLDFADNQLEISSS